VAPLFLGKFQQSRRPFSPWTVWRRTNRFTALGLEVAYSCFIFVSAICSSSDTVLLCNAYLLQFRSCFARKSIYFNNLRYYCISSTFFSWNRHFRSVSSYHPHADLILFEHFRIGNLLGQKDAQRAEMATRAALALVIVISTFTGFVPIFLLPKCQKLTRILRYFRHDICEVLGVFI
jgi:hypothetical protein